MSLKSIIERCLAEVTAAFMIRW